MVFEFDPEKSASNRNKHNIDFVEAQDLWDDPDRVVIPAKNLDEPRYLLIAKRDGLIWSAIYTVRGQNIRIISVRRSRRNEEELYES
ncbi:BrnT family toxin [candidate division KSB1 bacterium]|nr:MAG: BrnT family toxin [candidate division KSB1 bacterium]MBC6950665.1 BrnT family toxin [candidate division KSB1 bacterium]MCE7943532.1 BrnT family toxin [Chlorobi bacterium CHB1]MDL1876562.1 BrnT family toxin [Cytophagia bacterium CHB2]